jgi:peptidoglycan hydrolase-like protein with peptidoglycan-binding domain
MTLLQIGSRGTAVTALQKQLQSIGYPLPKYGADGKFEKETWEAVIDFQRKNSLKIDGIVGPATQAKLNEKSSSLWNKVTNIFSPTPTPIPVPPPSPTVSIPQPPAVEPVVGVELPPAPEQEGGIHPVILIVGGLFAWKVLGKKGKRK